MQSEAAEYMHLIRVRLIELVYINQSLALLILILFVSINENCINTSFKRAMCTDFLSSFYSNRIPDSGRSFIEAGPITINHDSKTVEGDFQRNWLHIGFLYLWQ